MATARHTAIKSRYDGIVFLRRKLRRDDYFQKPLSS
jgi:hypothetical protein